VTTVYIAEVIWFGDNPVDGRRRVAVCTTLESAVAALQEDGTTRGNLVATETMSALGSKAARTWAVHEPDEEPDDEGCLWVTSEQLREDTLGASRGHR
jgi:hypothetical protein